MAIGNQKRRVIFFIILVCGLIILAGFIYLKWYSFPKPNVLIIISDALRRDHLGCYGYSRDTSPDIDLFAKNAVLYKNAFAQAPSTKPSVASIFTSQYPSQHQAIYNNQALDTEYRTLAEVLKDNDYITAGFTENPQIARRFHYDQGFDTWELDDRRHGITSEPMDDFDRKIFAWLDAHCQDTFFLYIHYIDPHIPYQPPEPFCGFFDDDYTGEITGDYNDVQKLIARRNRRDLEHVIALYDEEIRYINSRMKKLIKKLKQLKIWKDTIIIFTADHGEAFFDHGAFFTHSNSVYAEEINIPFILHYPRMFRRGTEERYIQHIDIFPTVLHMLKIDSAALSLEGNNFLSKPDRDIEVIAEHLRERKRPQRGLISKGWKLIKRIDKDMISLYDIEQDPTDSENVADEHPDIAGRLESRLSGWLDYLKDIKTPTQVELDDEMIDKLKSLGYLQ